MKKIINLAVTMPLFIRKYFIQKRILSFFLLFIVFFAQNILANDKEGSPKAENFLGVHLNGIHFYESAVKFDSYSSSGTLGFDFNFFKKMKNGVMVNAGFYFTSVMFLTVNDVEIDFDDYSWTLYDIYLRGYHEIYYQKFYFGVGGGFDIFIAGSKYFKNMKEENSHYVDLLISLGSYARYPVYEKIWLIASYNFSYNLTPGVREFVGINNLTSIQNKLTVGVLYNI